MAVNTSIRSRHNIKGIAVAFVALNALDYLSTEAVLRMGGVEYNPIINAVGVENLAAFKLAVTAGGLMLADATGKWGIVKALNIGLGLIVAGNFAAAAAGAHTGHSF